MLRYDELAQLRPLSALETQAQKAIAYQAYTLLSRLLASWDDSTASDVNPVEAEFSAFLVQPENEQVCLDERDVRSFGGITVLAALRVLVEQERQEKKAKNQRPADTHH